MSDELEDAAMTYCPGVPHEGHESEDEPCLFDHPEHIYRARARHAVRTAEREMNREIAKEIGHRPNTPMGMIRRAFKEEW